VGWTPARITYKLGGSMTNDPGLPTPDELRAFARDHLLYEVAMLRLLTDRLLAARDHDQAAGTRDLAWLDLATRNAQVEAFAIHARAALGFLHEVPKPKPNKEDALARHYAPGWEPPPLTPTLSKVPDRVGQEIAHLSYGRRTLEEEARAWPYGEIWIDVAAVLRRFAEQASPELLPEDVARLIQDLTVAPREITTAIESALSAVHGATSIGF
jgi:hypothetical protein